MLRYHVYRYSGDCEVLLLPHKDGSGYSYVNLTAGHICPCKFNTISEALFDMENKLDVKGYDQIECEV